MLPGRLTDDRTQSQYSPSCRPRLFPPGVAFLRWTADSSQTGRGDREGEGVGGGGVSCPAN